MAGDLQALVDSLGRRLQRPAAIDDPHMRLLAYTSHFGHVDEVRRASILHRKAPAEAISWVNGLGIHKATAPMRIPANPRLGMDPRVCMPIRCHGHLLGYVWLLDNEPALDAVGLEIVDTVAHAAGEILHRERLLGEIERTSERELLRNLISDQPQLRKHAADELVEANLMVSIGSVAVLVVRPAIGEALDDPGQVSMGLALEQVRRTVSPRQCLHLVRPDHGLLFVATDAPSLRPKGVVGLGRQLAVAVASQFSAGPGWSSLVGVGETQLQLADSRISYWQAWQACRIAQVIPSFRPVATWSQLGMYQTLLQFPIEELTTDALHPGLRELFRERTAGPLVQTLERYFDVGCDAKRTAADLRIHRASLYYRLQKIEKIASVSLRSGDDRLAMHLGLKLARLAGILPGSADIELAGWNHGLDPPVASHGHRPTNSDNSEQPRGLHLWQ